MTQARRELVDPSITRWYHTISRCVRQLFLLGDGREHRKKWIEERLEELSSIFAISVGGFSAMDNHLHVVCRLDVEQAEEWTDEEVVRRWGRLYPPRNKNGEPLDVSRAWIEAKLADTKWIATARERLASLGWFMKCLKEPLARMANKEDGCKGVFFDGRYKSIALLDEEALLATAVYVDLNPVAAGSAKVPEQSEYTSIQCRVTHVRRKGRRADLVEALKGSVAASRHSGDLEDDLWLCPVEDRRRYGSRREGMLEGFTLGNYLLLIDATARLFRDGKASMSSELAGIFDRFDGSADGWLDRMKKLSAGRCFGRFFATRRDRLRETAKQLGRHHLANLDGCAA